MDLYAKIYNYCERGSSAAFWAEPLNAVSNIAFIAASLMAAWLIAQRARRGEHVGAVEVVLTIIVFIVGVGSFLFHTYATRWASYADVIPIGVFMIVYMAYALRRFMGLPWILVLVGLSGFVWSLKAATTIQCAHLGLLPITDAATGRCLNGSIAYTPALAALAITAVVLALMRHKAALSIGTAAAIFLVSLAARSLDFELCEVPALVAARSARTRSGIS